jgi:hypothetical protein
MFFFSGRRERQELPHYIKAFDVCLNAFRTSRADRHGQPFEIQEYLASGKPIASVPCLRYAEFR